MNKIINPVLDLRPRYYVRDPAVIHNNGTYYSYNTLVERIDGVYSLKLGMTKSTDLQTWSEPTILIDSPLNFSSPGNVFRYNDKWYLCVQSYPIDEGEMWGNETSRLCSWKVMTLKTGQSKNV